MSQSTDRADAGANQAGDPGRRSWLRWAVPVGMLSVAAWVGFNWDRNSTDGGMVEKVQGAAGSISRGVRSTSASLMDGLKRGRAQARNSELGSQVRTRLLQDKTLEAGKIEVRIEGENTAILEGLVPSADDKDKAVSLTGDTRGILRVVDRLAVPPRPRVIEAPAADDPAPAVSTLPRAVR